MRNCQYQDKVKLIKYVVCLGIALLIVNFFINSKALPSEEKTLGETNQTALCDGNHTGYAFVDKDITQSGKYVLNKDFSSPIVVYANDVTLCLNGFDIGGETPVNLNIYRSKNFTLHDCGTNVRYYKIDPNTKLLSFNGATAVDNDGSITGGAIYEIVGEDSVISLLGGNVVGNASSNGSSAIFLLGCNGIIKNMNIIGNKSALYLDRAEYESSNICIEKTNIKQNYSQDNNITVTNIDSLKIIDSVVSQNYGSFIISALYPFNTDVNITQSIINQNYADYGGGLCLFDVRITLSDSQVIENEANTGGGIYISGGELTLNNTEITNNIAISDNGVGGMLVSQNSTKLSFSDTVIIDQNKRKEVNSNLYLEDYIIFNNQDMLNEGSKIGVSFKNDDSITSISNINSANVAYFVADELTKIVVDNANGGLTYKDKKTITFNSNFSMGGSVLQQFGQNTAITLNKNTFIRSGYDFLGWSTNPRQTVQYLDGQENVVFDDDITLYAIWHRQHHDLEFQPLTNVSHINTTPNGVYNYVLTTDFIKYGESLVFTSGTINLCIDIFAVSSIQVSGSANLNIFSCANGIIYEIDVSSSHSILKIDSGNIGNIIMTPAKELHISGGRIEHITAMMGDFNSNTIGKIYLSGNSSFKTETDNPNITILTSYNAVSGKLTRGAVLVLDNGKTGDEYDVYSGSTIKVAIDYAISSNSTPLFGQVVAEKVFKYLNGKPFNPIELVSIGSSGLDYRLSLVGDKLIVAKKEISLFDDEIKFTRNNLWDAFRSPAYPSSNRPFYLYGLAEPYDAKMNRIDFTNGKYVKFQQNLTYSTVADLPISDKNRIISSLRYSTYSNEQAILKALIVSEILYNSDGTKNSQLAKIGLIWSLGEQGFLYTSLDADGAFPYSGGIGTYVTFKASNNGDSIIDTTPKSDPLSKDDVTQDSNGNNIIQLPTMPDNLPPINNDVYISYVGRVIDNKGNPLLEAKVVFIYAGKTFKVTTDSSGYFSIFNILKSAGQCNAIVNLDYSDSLINYGTKTYVNMPLEVDDVVTYIYPLTINTNDGVLQFTHTLTKVDYVEATCSTEGKKYHYICEDIDCGCGKIYGDALGQNKISLENILISKTPHTKIEISRVEASCKETGLTTGIKCSVCDEIIVEQSVIPKLEHTKIEISGVEASCKETGLTTGIKCSVCDEIIVEQSVIPKLEHTEIEISRVEASCKESGLTTGIKCSVCDEIIVEQSVIPKLEHTKIEISRVEASCKETGLTAGIKCSVCDEIIVEQSVIPMLQHYFDDGKITVQPTKLEEGEKTYTCTVCGDTKVEIIPKISHDIDKTPINLMWLTILLAIINLLEFAVIVFLVITKRKSKKEDGSTKLSCDMLLPLLVIGVQLSNIILSITFGVLAILQAVIIVVLLKRQKSKNFKTKDIIERNLEQKDN